MLTKTAALTAIAVSAIASSQAVAATRLEGVALKPWTNQFVAPIVVEVVRDKGKLRVEDATVNVPIRIGGVIKNVIKAYEMMEASIRFDSFPWTSNYYVLLPGTSRGPRRNINQNKVLHLTAQQSQPFTKQALDICGKHKDRSPRQYPMKVSAQLKVEAGYQRSNGDFTQRVTKHASTSIDAFVNCPGAVPSRTPVDDVPAIPPKVKSVDLAIVNGIGACPKPVFVVGTFEADRAGSFDVLLRRDNGNTERRTITAVKQQGKFIARFDKTYNFTSDVRRKYMIEVIGQARASAWTPMTLNCGGPGTPEKPEVKVK